MRLPDDVFNLLYVAVQVTILGASGLFAGGSLVMGLAGSKEVHLLGRHPAWQTSCSPAAGAAGGQGGGGSSHRSSQCRGASLYI